MSVYKEEVFENNQHLYVKHMTVDFSKFEFGNLTPKLESCDSDSQRYTILADAYQQLVNIGFYPEGTVFNGLEDKLYCEMPYLELNHWDSMGQEGTSRFVNILKETFELKKVNMDLYWFMNYIPQENEVKFIDLEIFPERLN